MTHKRTKCGVEKRRVGLCWAKRRKRRKEGRELKKFSGRKREKGEKKSAVRVGISFLNGLSFLHHACVYVNVQFVYVYVYGCSPKRVLSNLSMLFSRSSAIMNQFDLLFGSR